MKAGDIVVAAGGRPVRGIWEYTTRIFGIPLGKTIDLQVLTEGGYRDFTLPVTDLVVEPRPMPAPASLTSIRGLVLSLLLPGHPAYGTTRGVQVISAGDGPLARLGLKPEDVITAVDGSKVGSPHEVYEAVSTKMGRFRVEVTRDGRSGWFYLGSDN